MEISIVFLELIIRDLRNQGVERCSHRITDHINNGALEKDLENGCKISPETTSDVDLDIIAVNINNDIHSVDSHE